MKKVIFLFFLVLILGCNKDKPTHKNKGFNFQEISQKTDETNAVDIDLSYQLVVNNTTIAQKINRSIRYSIFSKLGLPTITDTTQYQGFIKIATEEFLKLKKQFPNSRSIGMEQNTDSRVSYNGDDILSIYIESYVYSGGAHGMEYREFLNFDAKTGEQIDLLQRIDSRQEFFRIAEQKLKDKLSIKPEEKLSDHTFMQQFQLPKNIGMTETGYHLIYNQYEILPYSEGHTELKISFDELSQKRVTPQ